jgi:hypothetical protein
MPGKNVYLWQIHFSHIQQFSYVFYLFFLYYFDSLSTFVFICAYSRELSSSVNFCILIKPCGSIIPLFPNIWMPYNVWLYCKASPKIIQLLSLIKL